MLQCLCIASTCVGTPGRCGTRVVAYWQTQPRWLGRPMAPAACGMLRHRARHGALDRFDYTAAVAESWKSQMLEPGEDALRGHPVFLDVGQIVTGYTVQSTFSATGTFSTRARPCRESPTAASG